MRANAIVIKRNLGGPQDSRGRLHCVLMGFEGRNAPVTTLPEWHRYPLIPGRRSHFGLPKGLAAGARIRRVPDSALVEAPEGEVPWFVQPRTPASLSCDARREPKRRSRRNRRRRAAPSGQSLGNQGCPTDDRRMWQNKAATTRIALTDDSVAEIRIAKRHALLRAVIMECAMLIAPVFVSAVIVSITVPIDRAAANKDGA